MTTRENALRTVRFEYPESIPMVFGINSACWQHYPQDALQALMVGHPYLFPGYVPQEKVEPVFTGYNRAGVPYTDEWGCVWETAENGIVGAVVKHPLADWVSFEEYIPPDAAHVIDWGEIQTASQLTAAHDKLVKGSLTHGHTFLRACDIRGYENVLLDMVDEDTRLMHLFTMIEEYNATIVQRYLSIGVEWMSYPEDLGMQVGPMISPSLFIQYVKPIYERLMAPAKVAGCVVHMHSDGDIRELVDDLIDDGVTVLNLQDLVNGLDWIKDRLAGRICIDLDIDRQEITRFGSPAQIDELIRQEVELFGSKQGGLMMAFGLYPGTPLENVHAVIDAMERYAGYYA